MNRQIFALWAVLAVGLAAAQNQPNQNPAQGNDASPAMVDDQRAPAPALLTGESMSLSFSPELERSNYLRGGIGVGATYDDNASSSPTNRIGDFSYSVLPSIELDQTRSRLHWTLGYTGGFTANQRLAERNQGSHNLQGTLQYRLSPHVDLRLSDTFLDVTGFLQQFTNGLETPVTGPVNQPNHTLITPLAKSLNNTGNVDLSYQYSASDVIGVGGTFYDSHFHDVPTGSASLNDTSTRIGDAYYNHRLDAHNWLGVTYKYQHIAFGGMGNLNITHSILFSDTISLGGRTTLSLYGGPEYSHLDTVSVTMNIAPPVISFATVSNTEHTVSGAFGASLGWQGSLTSLRMAVSRQVSDGGGLLGAVQLTSVSGGIRRQFTKSTAADLNVTYGHNRELGSALAGQAPFQSATGGVGLSQGLGAHLMLRLDYYHDYQKGNLGIGGENVNHNRGSVTISYSFTRPIGR
jgi:hypothetical protein